LQRNFMNSFLTLLSRNRFMIERVSETTVGHNADSCGLIYGNEKP